MNIPKEPDYNEKKFWVRIPENETHNNDKKADVFFVHGTVLHSKTEIYLDPHNEELRQLPLRPRMTHAGSYDKTCRIFNPHYRQLTMEAHLADHDTIVEYYKVPTQDIINAYFHYMENWNNGRPLILAGNSQGSILILALLKHLKAINKIPKNLISANIIGYTVTQKDLDELEMELCNSPTQQNCIISYNTLAKGGTKGFTLLPNALCVNPLSWTTSEEIADKSLHLGFIETEEDGTQKIHDHATNAWIDKKIGAVIVDIYDIETAPPREYFPKGDLHSYNYPLFFKNIEANTEERVNAFFQKK